MRSARTQRVTRWLPQRRPAPARRCGTRAPGGVGSGAGGGEAGAQEPAQRPRRERRDETDQDEDAQAAGPGRATGRAAAGKRAGSRACSGQPPPSCEATWCCSRSSECPAIVREPEEGSARVGDRGGWWRRRGCRGRPGPGGWRALNGLLGGPAGWG